MTPCKLQRRLNSAAALYSVAPTTLTPTNVNTKNHTECAFWSRQKTLTKTCNKRVKFFAFQLRVVTSNLSTYSGQSANTNHPMNQSELEANVTGAKRGKTLATDSTGFTSN